MSISTVAKYKPLHTLNQKYCRGFFMPETIANNTSTGTLRIQVTSALGAVPIQDAVLTLTEKSGQYGHGEPVTSTTSVAGTITPDTTTAPVGVTKYITYVFGDGAIEYTNCGAKVPYEMSRDPKTNGGQDTLYSRQRKCFAPYGISFTKASMAKLSPTNAELELGVNWELVNSNEQGTKDYISLKAIPIARIISLG